MSNLITGYNPDVLSCLANLSNDEVFTPPEVANAMLDMLPQELFRDPNTRFLDPACKSGVFLREIAKRLIDGLADQIPDLQERIDHIFHEQLYGIAITELTSLLSRRSLYCTKYPNSVYSVSKFDDQGGNIRYKKIQHFWKDGKCIFCGVTQKEGTYDREGMEIHAYELLHSAHPERIFQMKFDVIIGNPPYQLNVGIEKENFAIPIYQKFIAQAKRLEPRFLCMIIPARWYTGGRGLDAFRKEMLNDRHIKVIVDFPDSKDCFQGVDIAGGICYFLRDKDYEGDCSFTSIQKQTKHTAVRSLNEFDIFPRYNQALSVIHKVLAKKEKTLQDTVSVQTPFGFITTYHGKKEHFPGSLKLKTSKDDYYVSLNEVTKNKEIVNKYKPIFGAATCEHAGTPGKDGRYKVFSSLEILPPGVICTQSYFVADSFDSENEAANLISYLKTKTVRFLVLQSLTSQHLARDKFLFVPQQDYSKPWADTELYKKYDFSDDEISFIEETIREYE